MTQTHPFDETVALTAQSDGRWTGDTGTAYGNFVGAFGGAVSAMLLNSVMKDDRTLGSPVSQTVNLCAPLAQGGFTIQTKLQRGGKYTQHWNVELFQNDAIIATASIVMGNRSETFSHQPAQMGDVTPASKIDPLPNTIPLEWTNRYDFRFAEGMPIVSGKPNAELGSPHTKVWISDNPPRPLDYLSLSAIADGFFVRLLQVRGTMEPMGTVSLTTHFLATPEELNTQGTAPLLGVADSNRMHNHFHDQTMQLFGTDGTILATGTQVVWYRQ